MSCFDRQHGFKDLFSEDFEEFVNLVTKKFVLQYIGELVNNPINEEHLFNDFFSMYCHQVDQLMIFNEDMASALL